MYGDAYPPLNEMIGSNPIEHKEKVYNYMKKARVVAAAPAILRDYVNGERIDEELLVHTDDVYEWTSDIAYYFNKYNYKLPDDFIQHVLRKEKIIS